MRTKYFLLLLIFLPVWLSAQKKNLYVAELNFNKALSAKDTAAIPRFTDELMNGINEDPSKFELFYHTVALAGKWYNHTKDWQRLVKVSQFMAKGYARALPDRLFSLVNWMTAAARGNLIRQRDSAQQELLALSRPGLLRTEGAIDTIHQLYILSSFHMIAQDTLDDLFTPMLERAKQLSGSLPAVTVLRTIIDYSDSVHDNIDMDRVKKKKLALFLMDMFRDLKNRGKAKNGLNAVNANDVRLTEFALQFKFGRLFSSGSEQDEYAFVSKNLTEAKALLGDTSIQYADMLNDMGDHFSEYFNSGGQSYLDSAIYYLERSIALKSKIGDTMNLEYVRTLNNLAYTCIQSYRPADAAVYFNRVLRLKKQIYGENSIQAGVSAVRFASMCETTGQYAEAEDLIHSAIAIFQDGGKTEVKHIGIDEYVAPYTVLARIYEHFNNFARARLYYDTALQRSAEYAADSSDRYDIDASIYHDIGYMWYEYFIQYRDTSALDRSESYFKKSISLKQRLELQNTLTYSITERFLGVTLLAKKEYNKAMIVLKKNLAMRAAFFKGKPSGYVGTVENSIGSCYMFLKQYDSSELYFKRAHEQEKYSFVDYTSLNNLIQMYIVSGQYAKIAPYVDELLSFLESRFKEGLYLSEDQKELSYKEYERSLDVLYSLMNKFGTGDRSLLLKVYKVRQAYKSLIFRSSESIRRTIYAKNDRTLQAAYQRLVNIQRALARNMGSGAAENANIDQDSLRNIKDNLEKYLIKRVGLIPELEAQSGNLAAIGQRLKSDEMIIDFVSFRDVFDSLSEGRIGAFILYKDSIYPEYRYICREDALQRYDDPDMPLQNKANQAYYTENWAEDPSDSNRRLSLFDLLIAPLNDALQRHGTVWLVPDGLLNTISFESIMLPDKKYLFEHQELHYIYNVLSFPDANVPVPKPDSLVLFGDISYGNAWPSVPGSGQECGLIRKIMAKAGVPSSYYTATAATESAFRSLKPKKNTWLHISTHGYFHGEEGNKSINQKLLDNGLVLAGANGSAGSNDPENDGFLSALDIVNMDLNKIKLVVLSACETGLGQNAGNEGVLGFRRAFKLAGAGNIVASLWPVYGTPTAEFMELFYGFLASGHTPFQSLKMARMRQKQKYPLQPDFWGAFILIE